MPLQDLKDIKALAFDVFGTTVDWRSSVESALRSALATKLTSSSSSSSPSPSPLLSQPLQEQVQKLLLTTTTTTTTTANNSNGNTDWASTFAQEWRNAYKVFTRSFRAGQTPWKDIDTHHHDSLVEQLDRWGLQGLFTPSEIQRLSLVWHRLTPWPDTAAGLHRLGGLGLVTATLSNGTRALLSDLNNNSTNSGSNRQTSGSESEQQHQQQQLGFARIISAEDFGAYKPDPKVYLGAAEKLGVSPGELAMVAAHLNDLEAARALGLRTVYVERRAEEDWDPSEDRYQRAKGWVDLWVGLDDTNSDPDRNWEEEGFVEVARRLGGVLVR